MIINETHDEEGIISINNKYTQNNTTTTDSEGSSETLA